MGSVHVPPSHVQIVIGSFMIRVPGILFIHFIYPLARLEIVTIAMCGTGISPIESGGYIDRVVIRLQVRPPQDFSSMARPALKPLVESDEGSASSPLLDPPSVVAASRLMQEVGGEVREKSAGREETFGVWRRLRIHVFGPIYLHVPYKSTKCRWIYHRWMA